MKYTEAEYKQRERLRDRIEAYCGSCLTMPWHEASTEDLKKILRAILCDWSKFSCTVADQALADEI